MLLDTVFQYRTLLGKCELGIGLDWDEIAELDAIESAFAPSEGDLDDPIGRRFRREPTKITAMVRGDRIHDRVDIVELGPGGFVCQRAPYIARGEVIELSVDIGDQCLRFAARGTWLQEEAEGDDYRVGLELFGMPVRLRTNAVSLGTTSTLDQIAA